MPEIKNTFTQGKMNKDLDERMIPNGQYRDALNIEVTSAENGGSGTARNILGNTRVDDKVVDTCICVGSISNEQTNKLYWFVHCEDRDAILEYDQNTDETQCMAVDINNSFLNFTGSQITGINIIDDFLFWTDGNNEPKKINISKSHQTNPNTPLIHPSQLHAKLRVDGELTNIDLEEKHVSVIKIKPSSAPTFKINLLSSGQTPVFEKVFPRFCYRYKYVDGEYSAFGPFTDVVFSAKYPDLVNKSNSYFTDEPYNKAMTNSISSIELCDFVSSDIPEDVVQVDILYKQEDSNVIYSIANIKNTDPEWSAQGTYGDSSHKGKYVITSDNVHAALPENQLLRPFDAIPKSAKAQEIVGNRIVYANYKQGYNFNETNPKPNINAGYKSKGENFDSGGQKSIKSSRNYQLGYILGDKYGRETPVFTSDNAGVNITWFGEDLAGNASTANMFTGSLSSQVPDWAYYYKFYVKSSSAEYYNLLMDKCYFPFSHTEFENKDDHIYVSFPSSDRNKIMEDDYIIAKKIYDGSEAQVFQENKYKILDISNEAPDAVKYIFFNLGTAVNNNDVFTGTGVLGFGGEDNILFAGPGHAVSAGLRIDQQTDVIHMHKTSWLSSAFNGSPLVDYNEETESQVENYKGDIYMSWSLGNISSNRYKISSIRVSNGNVYVLKLTTTISEKDARIAALNDNIEALNLDDLGAGTPNTQVTMDAGLTLKFERRQKRSEEDFSGKFFVKIKHNAYLTASESGDTGFFPVAEAGLHWLFDVHNTTDLTETTGIINSASQPIASALEGAVTAVAGISNLTGFASEPEDWSAIKSHIGNKFFIDDMNFVACNVSSDSLAKESGPAWRGLNSPYSYPPFEWTQVDGDESPQSGLDNGYYWRAVGPHLAEGGYGSYGSLKSFTPSAYGSALTFSSLLARIINSFEGIVTSTLAHSGNLSFSNGSPSSGERRFRNNTLYSSTGSAVSHDNTYGPENVTGKHFIHISFLAPGVDLIDAMSGDDFTGVAIKGKDSIASELQGIWGGGAFTKVPTEYATNHQGNLNSQSADMFGNIGVDGHVVEFEGNYNELGNGQPEAPGPGVGQGYDLNHTIRHNNQWNPAYSETGSNPIIQTFLQKIKTAGQKFIFKEDTSETVYTILSVSEKHMYNHTPWRMRWLWNDTTGDWDAGGDSVEEAASAWADFTGTDLKPSTGNTFNPEYIEAATALADAITNFGAADNRRVTYIIELDKNPAQHYDPRFETDADIDATDSTLMQFVSDIVPSQIDTIFSFPTIWETEPQQLADLNIYYEASNNIPTRLTSTTNELFAPVGSRVEINSFGENYNSEGNIEDYYAVSSWIDANTFEVNPTLPDNDYVGSVFVFHKDNGSYVKAEIVGQDGSQLQLNTQVDVTKEVGLSWSNCFSFGDGIESNRIRDGYNKMQISSGARVSATLEEPFMEEHRTNGLIYSGIYNSNSNVNNLNQFIAAEKITKDLNPTYGSIQKLFTRNTDLVALCEDRVIKILANKDALFNADGNPQLIASNRVLGQAVPFQGDYGISNQPESFASDTYRAYFTDKQRGAVLRLSMDGLTPISDAGMREYFRDNLINKASFIGSYDQFDEQYNLTIKKLPVIGSILNDDLSVGIGTTESFNLNDFITDGTFTQGLSFSGQVLFEDLPLEERTITQNSELEGNVTIINHPAIDVLVPPQPIFETQTETVTEIIDVDVEVATDVPVTIPDAFEDGNFTMFGFDTSSIIGDSQVGDPFSSTYGFGSTDTKFYLNRFTNITATSNNSNDAVIEMTGGFDGNDFDLGFGDDVSGNTDDGEWSNRVFCFADTGITQTPSDSDANGFIGTGSDLLNGGIIFRGSPNTSGSDSHTPWGYMDFPVAGFVSGGNNIVPQGVLDTNSNAQNNWVFNGEEIEIEIKYRANNYGNERQNYVRFRMFDGSAHIFSDDLGGNTGDGFTHESVHTFPNITSDTNAGTQDIVQTLKYQFSGGALGDVFSNNLTFRLEVWTDGIYGTDDLEDLGETVITGFQAKKTKRLINQDYDTVEVVYNTETQQQEITVTNEIEVQVGETNSIPLEPIPAWAEVIYPNAIDGFIMEAANLDHGLEEQFGPENPGESISYTDLAGNQLTYLSGASNGVTEYSGDASETTVPINHLISGFNVNALLDPNKPLELNKWYMVEIKVNQLETGPSPFIKFQSDVPGETYQSTLSYFNSSPSNLQIGTYYSNNTIILAPVEVIPPGQMVHRALFRLHSSAINADTSQINKMMIGFYSQETLELNESIIEEVRLIDVSVEATGGFADNWNINPENYQIQRAVIESTNIDTGLALNVPQNTPAVYYMNGQINFSSLPPGSPTTTREVSQDIQTLQQTQDGYELVITLGDDAISGISTGWEGPNSVGTSGNPLKVSLPTAGIEALELPNTLNTIPLNFNGEDSGSIIFNAPPGFTGSIQSVSLKDVTNYFSAGSAGAWIIEGNTTGLNPDGEEVVVENFIEWSDNVNDDGQIFFNGATSGSRIYQEVELPVGQTFQLTFDAAVQGIPAAGSLKVSYRNASGVQVDQKLIIQSTDGNNLLFEFTVDEGEGQPQDLPSCVVFEAIGEIPLYASVDNIKLRRIITDAEFGIPEQTISYKESSKGWESFKSFIPENGLSLSSQYFTTKNGQLWKHYNNEDRNMFYGIHYNSELSVVLNDSPSIVKNFKTINYEGSQAKTLNFATTGQSTTLQPYNANGAVNGWEVTSILTNLEEGQVPELIEKENKWFNYIKGIDGNIDTSSFNFQGIGVLSHTTND